MINPISFDYSYNMPKQDNLYDALVLEGIINKKDKWETYIYKDSPIPRVSEILKTTIGKDYLMKWALKLGAEDYTRESNMTLYTGTIVHEMIEHFLTTGKKKEINYRSYSVMKHTEMAYNNFISWYRDMINKGYTISPIVIEKPVTCPWYGGTIDCILSVTDPNNITKIYLSDFKTSKSLSIDYLLQTYAYYWAIEWNRHFNYNETDLNINIDGICIIRIDKEKSNHEILVVNKEDKRFTDIAYGFSSMVNWYYHIINLEYDLKMLKKENRDNEWNI